MSNVQPKTYEMGNLIAASMFRNLLIDIPGAMALMKGSFVMVSALPEVHEKLAITAERCRKAAAYREAQRLGKVRETRAKATMERKRHSRGLLGPLGGPPIVRKRTGRINMVNSILLASSPERQRKMHEGRLRPRWHTVFLGAHLKPLLERVKNPPRCAIDPENPNNLLVFVNAYQLMTLRKLARGRVKKRYTPQQYHLPPYLFGMSPALALERLKKRGVNAEKGNNCVLVIGKGQTQRKARRILYGN